MVEKGIFTSYIENTVKLLFDFWKEIIIKYNYSMILDFS
jgi:hypothetical protein